MNNTVMNFKRTRRTIKKAEQMYCSEKLQQKSGKKSNIPSAVKDQQSQIYVSDDDSAMLTHLESNVGDITENLDSVYSPNNQIQQNQLMTKTSTYEKMKIIRYTAKREKDLKKRKQKNRGKKFTIQEDERLLAYIEKKGPKFHKFSRYFPGKSTNMLKNRYYKQLRFKSDLVPSSDFNLIQPISDVCSPQIEEEEQLSMFSDIVSLKLFSEAEDILSNFVGQLSQTFQAIQAGFLLESD